MNKLFAMLLAVILMLGIAAVTVCAEGTGNLVEDYEIVEEDTEIVDDEVETPAETPKPTVIVAKPAESAPAKTETAPKKEDKKPAETRPAAPTVPEKEDEISEPQIIPEDTEDGWSIDLGSMEDFFSDIPFGDLFGSLTSGDLFSGDMFDPAPETGEPLDEEGNAYTRDLQYDKDCHKQFITVQTRSGNMFYIIIDYDSPINAEEEQYQAYFLNMVDDADLLALLDEETAAEMTTCTCKDKCVLGKVNADCPVCKNDLTGCKGVEPEPPKVDEPPAEETPTEEPKQEKKNNNMLPIIGVIGVVAVGGLAFYYFKFIKGKKKDDMDFYDDEGYEEHYVNEDEDSDSGGEDEEDLAKVDEEE